MFEDSLLGIVESSLCEGPIHFSCFPNFPISLSDPNIMKALTLNIKTEGFDMIDGTENVVLLYRICYKIMNSTISNFRINTNQISSKRGETTLFITDITKINIMIPKTINWSQVILPEIWKMESISPSLKEESRKLESIIQYVDGDVEIKLKGVIKKFMLPL